MVMLSDLLRYSLVNSDRKKRKLDDLVIDLQAEADPPIVYFLWHETLQEKRRTPWQQVQSIDKRSRQLVLEELGEGELVDPDWLAKVVLLKRDILDALILDLKDRSSKLANDLWLEEENGQLLLRAVDVSFLAILRRLSGGLIPFHSRSLREWKYVEFLRGDLQAARAGLDYHGLISRLPPGDIAHLADLLPYLYVAELLTLLPDPVAADTLEVLMPELKIQVFEELEESQAARLLALMRPDIVADLLAGLEIEQVGHWLERMPQLESERVLQLMRFPKDTAGGIMTNDIITLPAETRVKDALNTLRELLQKPDYVNFIQTVYVVENENGKRLRGALSLRDLLVAEDRCRLEEVMTPYLLTIHPLETADKAARRVIESALTSLPVVGENGEIFGVVTVDAALTLINSKKGRQEVMTLFS